MKKLLPLTAVAEATTGLALLVVPAFVGRLLLGVELTGVSIPVARVAGGRGACCPDGAVGACVARRPDDGQERQPDLRVTEPIFRELPGPLR